MKGKVRASDKRVIWQPARAKVNRTRTFSHTQRKSARMHREKRVQIVGYVEGKGEGEVMIEWANNKSEIERGKLNSVEVK